MQFRGAEKGGNPSGIYQDAADAAMNRNSFERIFYSQWPLINTRRLYEAYAKYYNNRNLPRTDARSGPSWVLYRS